MFALSPRLTTSLRAIRPLAFVGVSAVLLLAGCQGWPGGASERFAAVAAAPVEAAPVAAAPGRAEKPITADSATAADAAFGADEVNAVLAKPDAWSLRPASRGAGPGESSWRWQDAALERFLAEPARLAPALTTALTAQDPTTRANAAIALARLGDASGKAELVAAVAAAGRLVPLRCAAAEALGSLAAADAVPALRELMDRYGDVRRTARARYRPELHRELLAGLARHVDPAEDARFLDALRSPDADVRAAALEAWARGRAGALPDAAAELARDPDARVRAAAMRALARRRHPKAGQFLAGGARDFDLHVRLAAIAGLGEMGGGESIRVLEEIMASRGEAIRAAAVSALAAAGEDEPVFAAATDKAWQVRVAVADALPRWPNPRGVKLARGLLDDQSTEVQQNVLKATDAWPLAQAGPILLAALGKAPVMTRRIAAEKLAARWPEAQAFPEQGAPENRAAALADLTARFRRQFGDVEQASAEGPAAPGEKPPPVTPEQLARTEAILANLADPRLASADRQRALENLAAMGPDLVETLSILAVDRNQVLPEEVYADVLPKQDPVFAAMDRLRSADVIARRRAASELAQRAADRPAGRLAVARLARLVAEESDALVWRSVLAAVASDSSEPSIRLAYTAIGNAAPEVRRRACENLAARPSPRHASVLLPALEDPSLPVASAAIAALVAGGRLDDTRPLRQLLATPNEPLRVEVAAALVRFGDPAGVDTLGQLAYSRDVAVRQQVAQAMGDLADPRFTPALIRMLDDHLTVRRVALASLPKVVGHDAPHGDNQPPRNTAERISLWKDWFGRQGNAVSGKW